MKRLVGIGLALFVILAAQTPAHAILITFEEGLGLDGQVINTQYTGVTFQAATSGIPWLYADTVNGTYNASSWPSGSGGGAYWVNDSVAAWTTEAGDDGKISFDNQNASFVQLNYSSSSMFYLEAYDATNTLIDSDSGPGNLRTSGNESGPGTLSVSSASDNIAYVLVHDSGNYWVVDNVSTDATGIVGPPSVPEPASVVVWALLGTVGLAVGWRRRRK